MTGDSPNDLEVMSWAGLAVAVQPSPPEVLAVADEVVASPEANGESNFIEHLLQARVSSEAPDGRE